MFQVFSIVLFLFVKLIDSQDESEVDFYVDVVSDAVLNAQNYELPDNAYQYLSWGKRRNLGSFDFVVVGSGSAGSVVASRLSEIRQWSVLVLEAGMPGNATTDVPFIGPLLQLSNYNWGFKTIPQTNACLGMIDQSCAYPRGKGLGGSSLINFSIYSRGHKLDFEKWSELVGSERWNYPSVLNYFKKSEDFVHNDPEAPYEPEYHGRGGYLRVEYHKPRSPQLNAFLEANKEIGFDAVDYNANKLGPSPSQLTTINGERLDTAKAFLDPVRNRKNLKILTESYVTKITFHKKRKIATGVEFSHRGRNYFVKARKEVVLSAGAFGSAQILMLSGIGPKKHLEEVGIEVVADLEVGSTLRDHAMFIGITVDTNYTEPIESVREYVRKFLDGEGPYTISGNGQGVGFYESSYSNGTGNPDIELGFFPANSTGQLSLKTLRLTNQTYQDLWENNIVPQSFIIFVGNMHTSSVGTLRLKSNSPYDYSLIDPNLLSDPENRDANILYDGIKLVLRLLETEAFKAIDAKLQGGPLQACENYEYLSEKYWRCAIRQLGYSVYHPVGTCLMGKDPEQGAVVDANLKVYGIRNLRVADTSVIPITLACHTNAPAIMVGEQLGDIIKEVHLKEGQI